MHKILLIEDEGALQKMMRTVFEEKRYTVFPAFDGETGLAMAIEQKPDLILLDLILPKKDGFMVLKELKEHEEVKHIPVVVLTNLEGMEDVERALALGAKSYLVKANYTADEIVAKVEEVLGK
ncbi:MAG: response regulator [bacterium]|nr:response regulator [bacterium]MDZ4296637.1 response regulator [Patescibacteria group bacterium]